MAQTSQEKLDQIRKQFEQLNKANEVGLTSTFTPNPAGSTQPLYGQGSIKGLTSAEKRKLRWSNSKDAAKGALSSIYGAAAFIPETLARIGTAGVDQIAGTDTQSKLDDIVSYIPNKLRDSSSNTKAFDKGQEYTDDALMVASLLTAGSTGPKAPKTKLKDLGKNPSKYSPTEALNIVRSAENAGVNSVKVGNVKLTPEQVLTKAQLNHYGDIMKLDNSNYNWINDTWNRPAYQQKLFSQFENSKKGSNMRDFRDIATNRTSTYGPNNFGDYGLPVEGEYHPLGEPLTNEQIAEMRQYLREEKLGGEGNLNPIYKDAIERGLYEFADAERAAANTSKARADALKKRNMSASERLKRAKKSSADERAKDSTNEQYSALDADADMARNDVQNMTLDEMYELWKAINAGQ